MIVREDDRRPFGEQLAALLPRLRRFAVGLTRSSADADDLVQAALERALTRIDQWQPGTRLDSWLFRIVQNLWIDERRALRRRGIEVGSEELLDMAGEDGRVSTERSLMIEDTWRAMAMLPDEQREVLMLVSVEGMAYAEAAAILGVPVGTVMSRLSRARKAISAAVVGSQDVAESRDV